MMHPSADSPARRRGRRRLRPPPGPLVVFVALAGLLLGLGGCATSSATPGGAAATRTVAAEGDRLCRSRRGAAAPLAARRLDPPLTPAARRGAVLALGAHGFSAEAVETAEVIGALDPLLRLGAIEPQRAREATAVGLRRLRLRQAVQERIMAAMLDISSTIAALDCEGERGDQVAVRLAAAEARRSRRLTLASILAGALTAGLTGGLGLAAAPTAADIVGIVGGAAEASAAGTLLLGEGSEAGTLRTEDSLLREVWERPARSRLFPETVWRHLNRPAAPGGAAAAAAAARGGPEGAAEPGATIADAVVAEWRAGDRFGRPGSAEERARLALLFGEGGRYTGEDLEIREAMLELLEAGVAQMSRDLRRLLAELEASLPVPAGP